MTAFVYHFDDQKYPTAFHNVLFGKHTLKFPTDYQLVARVECDNLEDAYRLTNAIDKPWHENYEVTLTRGPARSTSPGDVVALKDGELHFWLCMGAGWEEVFPEPEFQEILKRTN